MKRLASKKKSTPVKRSYKKTGNYSKGKNNTRIEIGAPKHQDADPFKLVDGVPLVSLRSSQDEQAKAYAYLKQLKPNQQHLVVPSRLKSTVLRIAARDFPDYRMKTTSNRGKGTVSIWRVH